MKTVVTTAVVDDAELAELLTARVDPVEERDAGNGVFELVDGPFDHYERIVEVRTRPDGTHDVRQTTHYELAIPVWGFLFDGLVRRAIRNPPEPGQRLWWLPPDRMDRRATSVLARLCVFAMISGYLGVMIGQLNPYFQAEFELSNAEVGDVGIAVRLAAVFALVVVAFADRRGRRTVLLFSTTAAIVLTATGALVPNVGWLIASQTAARTFSIAISLLVGIMSAEEMPKGARAFGVSMLVAAGALGAGGVVLPLQIAEVAPWTWRLFFVVPLVLLIPAVRVGRRLPESRRFEIYELAEEAAAEEAATAAEGATTAESAAADAGAGRESRLRSVASRFALLSNVSDAPGGAPTPAGADGVAATVLVPGDEERRFHRSHAFRFAVLAAAGLLLNVFVAPAGFFMNGFLKNERAFVGGSITLLQVSTTLPAGIMMIVGGRLAETRGRRLIGSIGTAAGVGFTVVMFLASGAALWISSFLSSFIGAMAIPALGVYGAELFPTRQRGLAAGGINLFNVFGAVIGLKLAGIMSGPEHFGSLGPIMALLGIGPLIVVFLIIAFYPETAQRELEEINPEDVRPPRGPVALEALDETWEDVHEHHPADHPHAGLPTILHHDSHDPQNPDLQLDRQGTDEHADDGDARRTDARGARDGGEVEPPGSIAGRG